MIPRTRLAKGCYARFFEAAIRVVQKQSQLAPAPGRDGDVVPTISVPVEPGDTRPLLAEFSGQKLLSRKIIELPLLDLGVGQNTGRSEQRLGGTMGGVAFSWILIVFLLDRVDFPRLNIELIAVR